MQARFEEAVRLAESAFADECAHSSRISLNGSAAPTTAVKVEIGRGNMYAGERFAVGIEAAEDRRAFDAAVRGDFAEPSCRR